jgi:hypothetical protein
MADSGLGPPSDQRIAFVFKLPLNFLGPNSSRLNWDEISEVFQRTPNPELKFWYGGNDSRYSLKNTSSYLEFH